LERRETATGLREERKRKRWEEEEAEAAVKERGAVGECKTTYTV
jgi:hypothetical protein